ncbi:MAG: Ig-like domain-containing protein [Alcanivorax sp.]|nr:Ig-like domain-containing protein [Alcanivorax sp.]
MNKVICRLGLLLGMLLAFGSAQALTSADSQDFESVADGTTYSSPATIGSFTFYSNSSGQPANQKFAVGSFFTHVGNVGLYAASCCVGDVTEVRIVGASTFKLNSIWLGPGAGNSAAVLHAYKGGVQTGLGRSVTLSDSSIDTSGYSEFQDIDELRITGADLDLLVDNIMVAAPATSDSDGNLTAGGGSEPGSIDTAAGASAALDFTLRDGGTSDGAAMTVSQVKVHVSGTSTATERTNTAWTLTGPDISGSVTGSYSGGVVTFSGLPISVADGASETYTVNANLSHSGLTEGHTFVLSLDGDTDLTTGSAGTQMGTTSAVSNGAGFATSVTATSLAFTTEPAGSVSGSALTTQPVVVAEDAFANADRDFSANVSLSEASAGTLSGTTTVAASSGVATFTNVAYTASADQEAFTLSAVASGLTSATASSVTSDVVATQLMFSTQPAPTSISSGASSNFTTAPVVRAVDANNTVDTGYSSDMVMSVTNTSGGAPTGTVNSLTGTGDTDGSGTTVTLIPSSGSATFNGLALQYTNGGSTDSIVLHTASVGLTTANSTTITSTSVPNVTDGNISISGASGIGGAYKIGDVVTATWNNTASGDNNSGITGVSVDFSQFGGASSVAASNSSGSWTATYVITAGSIDATNRNVSVSATNANGTSTTSDTSNASVDNIAPTVTDGNISISGASGSGGTYIIGDTVTVSWDNTGAGDNNSDTLAGVTVDFSQFGGGASVVASNSAGTWTATYTLTAGSVQASNRNVSVTATDNAGNSTTTADTSNASVDNTAPAAPSTPDLAASSDSGASNTDNITNDSTPTFTGTADANSSVTVISSVDGDLGTTTADAAGNWSFTPGAVLSPGSHDITATATDTVGNTGAASAALSITIDSSAPAGYGLAVSPSPVNLSNQNAITVTFSGAELASSYQLTISSSGGGTPVTRSGTVTSANMAIIGLDLSGLADGTVQASLTLTDSAGNTGSSASDTAPKDTVAPTLVSSSPVNNATNVALRPGVSLTFSEPVMAGSGASDHLTLTASDNTVVFDSVAAGANVGISSNTVALTLSNDLIPGLVHQLAVGMDALTDAAGNPYAGGNVLQFTATDGKPTANNDSFPVTEDTPRQLTVLSNDSVQRGSLNAASLVVASAPQHGSLTLDTGSGVLTYQPAADYNGSDSFTYQVQDSYGFTSNTATVLLTVNAVNDAPRTQPDSATTTVGQPITVDVLANDTEVDSGDSIDASSLQVFAAPSQGVAVVSGGKLSYTPPENFSGGVSLTYQVADSHGALSPETTVNIVVQSSAGPVAVDDSATVTEDTAKSINVLANDNGSIDTSTLAVVMQPQHGQVQVVSGQLRYQPAANDNGADSFSYRVADSSGASSNVANVSVTVTAVNDAPVANPDTVVVTGTSPVDINVTGNDSDVDSPLATATIEVTQSPAAGAVAINGGLIRYTPPSSGAVNDSFQYRLHDSGGAVSAPAQVTITTSAANQAPLAANDSATVDQNSSVLIDVLANDSDADGSLDAGTLNLTVPGHGSAVVEAGKVRYTPDAQYHGADSFSYQVADNLGAQSVPATVSVQVQLVNQPPVISGAPGTSVQQDQPYQFQPVASDPDNDPLTFAISNKPAWASFDTSTGQLQGTPGNSDVGTDTGIVISVSDGTVWSSLPGFSLTVVNVNDPPVAQDDSYSLNEGGILTVSAAQGVLANDSDPDNDTLTATLVSGPAYASSFKLNGDGSFSYQHDGSEHYSDQFRYQVSDGQGGVVDAVVNLAVAPVNDPPAFVSTPPTTLAAGSTLNYAVSVQDPDSTATLTLASAPAWLQLNGNTLTGTAPATAAGSDVTVVLWADDGQLQVQQSFTLGITATGSGQLQLDTQWTGLPAKVNQPLQLTLSVANPSGPDLTDATLVVQWQGHTVPQVQGCTQIDSQTLHCPLDLASGDRQLWRLAVDTASTGDQSATVTVEDSDQQTLASKYTDVSISDDTLTQGDINSTIAKATAITLLRSQGQRYLAAGTDGQGVTLYRLYNMQPVAVTTLDAGGHVAALASIDWNHDGLDDLVVLNRDTTPSAIYLNQGSEQFIAGPSLPAGNQLQLHDTDGDGYPDLLIGVPGLYRLPGSVNGQSTLQTVPTTLPISHFSAVGKGGLVTSQGNVLRYASLGISGVTASVSKVLKGEIRTLVSADINHDGLTDVVVGLSPDAQGVGGGVAVLTIDGNGQWQEQTVIGHAAVTGVMLGDMDGDGLDELLVQHLNGSWQRFRQNGALSQWALAPQAFYLKASLGLVADLNGDGLADLLLANTQQGTLAIYLGSMTRIGPQADVSVSATLGEMNKHQQRQYRITVQNHGPGDSLGTQLLLVIPQGLSVTDAPSQCVQAGTLWQCAVGAIASGDQQTLTMSLSGDLGAFYTKVLAVVSGSASDADTSNNRAAKIFGKGGGGGSLGWWWLPGLWLILRQRRK